MTQITVMVRNYEGATDDDVMKVTRRGLDEVFRTTGLDYTASVVRMNQPWDPEHDQDAICARKGCGHPYERHFDGFENNSAVGCKYCDCPEFVEPLPKVRRRRDVHRVTAGNVVYIQKGKR